MTRGLRTKAGPLHPGQSASGPLGPCWGAGQGARHVTPEASVCPPSWRWVTKQVFLPGLVQAAGWCRDLKREVGSPNRCPDQRERARRAAQTGHCRCSGPDSSHSLEAATLLPCGFSSCCPRPCFSPKAPRALAAHCSRLAVRMCLEDVTVSRRCSRSQPPHSFSAQIPFPELKDGCFSAWAVATNKIPVLRCTSHLWVQLR